MATFAFYDAFKGKLGDGTIDLDSHTFKAALTDTAPVVADDEVLADINEIAAGNGYTAGGVTLTASWGETAAGSGVWRFDAADFQFVASGGPIGPFRYVVVYDATADVLIGYWDRNGSLTLNDGDIFTPTIGAGGIFEF